MSRHRAYPRRPVPRSRRRAARRGWALAAAAALAVVFAAAACGGTAAGRSRPPTGSPPSQASQPTDAAPSAGTLRYRYMTDLPDGGVAARYGYNLADLGPDRSLVDALPDGVRALIWLGDYSHDTCSFTRSDAYVRAAVAGLAGDPKVAGYYIDDEADDALPADGGHCPDVLAQVTARSAVVQKLAPGAFTYQVVAEPGNYRAFAHATDVMGATAFPCLAGRACDWNMIPARIAALDAAHVAHYWGVLDAFGEGQWRWPTAAELTRMIGQWQRSRWEGQQTFAWNWRGSELASQPTLLDVLSRFNTGQLRPPPG